MQRPIMLQNTKQQCSHLLLHPNELLLGEAHEWLKHNESLGQRNETHCSGGRRMQGLPKHP